MVEISKGYKTAKKLQLSVWRLKCNKQATTNVFRFENATGKLKMLYLEVEIQQARYKCSIRIWNYIRLRCD